MPQRSIPAGVLLASQDMGIPAQLQAASSSQDFSAENGDQTTDLADVLRQSYSADPYSESVSHPPLRDLYLPCMLSCTTFSTY